MKKNGKVTLKYVNFNNPRGGPSRFVKVRIKQSSGFGAWLTVVSVTKPFFVLIMLMLLFFYLYEQLKPIENVQEWYNKYHKLPFTPLLGSSIVNILSM